MWDKRNLWRKAVTIYVTHKLLQLWIHFQIISSKRPHFLFWRDFSFWRHIQQESHMVMRNAKSSDPDKAEFSRVISLRQWLSNLFTMSHIKKYILNSSQILECKHTHSYTNTLTSQQIRIEVSQNNTYPYYIRIFSVCSMSLNGTRWMETRLF